MADINDIKEWLEEVLGIETYDGEINEFVDWVSGVDSFTNRNVTDGKPASGGSIRRLLQERLKKPIIVYDDEANGLYRLFSSEASRDRWISTHNPQDPSYDPDNNDYLEIFNFERPSEFVLSTNLTSDTRYIIKGDSESSESNLSFNVFLKDKDGQTKSDSLVVTYTITNNVTQVTQTFSEPFSSQYVNNPDNPITIDLYNYLDNGINSVNVNIKATTLSNSIDVGLNMYFITFSLDSSFDFNKAKTYGQTIEVPFEINRSAVVRGTVLYVSVYIDGQIAALESNGAEATWDDGGSTATRVNGSMRIKNTVENDIPTYAPSDSNSTHVFHTLRIEARMQSGHTVFNSNTLNYTFEIGSLTSDFYNKFVNIGVSLPKEKTYFDQVTGELILQGTQYSPFSLDWSYYTDNINKFQSIPVTWWYRIHTNNYS